MRRTLVLLLSSFAAGCASPIQSMMLTGDTALVSVIGNKPEDKGRVIDASLHEAARLAQSHGYRYFVVLDAADASKTRERNEAPRPSARERASGPVTTFAGGLVTVPVYRDFFKYPSLTVTYIQPGIDIAVRMYREGEIDPMMGGVWSTAKLLNPGAAASPAAP